MVAAARCMREGVPTRVSRTFMRWGDSAGLLDLQLSASYLEKRCLAARAASVALEHDRLEKFPVARRVP